MSGTVPISPPVEAPRSAHGSAWLVTRLVLRVTFALAAAGGMLLGYIAYFYPIGHTDKQDLFSTVGLCLALLGAGDVAALWIYLLPVRHGLDELASGGGNRDVLKLAARRAASFPWFGGIFTSGLWAFSAPLVAWGMRDMGVPDDTLLAGALVGLCTGVLSALLVYYISIGDLFPARTMLAGTHAPKVKGGTIGQRVLAISITVLMVGVFLVGATAYVNHRASSESTAASTCSAALEALAGMEVDRQLLVDAAAGACNGRAVSASNGRVYASSGAADILDVSRQGQGRLVSMPMRSGLTLYALVNDRARLSERASFAGEILGFTLLAVLMTAALALVGARAITTPLRSLVDGAEAVAEGDLTRNVPVLSADEVGTLATSFGEMNDRLRRLVREISAAAGSLNSEVSTVASVGVRVQRGMETRQEGVTDATREMTEMDQSVASVGRDVAGLAEYVSATGAALAEFSAALVEVRRQGTALDDAVKNARSEVQSLLKAAEGTRSEFGALADAAAGTLATVAQARETLKGLEDAAAESERVAEKVFSETESGKRVVEEGVRGMEAVRTTVGEARERVLALGERSADINAIVDFIAEVAGRTNLLSLNAAIIAAQAGEQGKAFGVVAEHIRELATQIGSSTKRIGDIIAGVRVEVDATSELIQRSDELASTGLEHARESWQALSRIAESTRRSREVTASILPAVTAHVDSTQQIEALASQVVDLARGFAGVDLLVRGGRSIEQIAQSLAPLTQRVGRALDEQALVSRKQIQNLEEINRMIARLDATVHQHGDGTARVLRSLSELVAAAEEDRNAARELASAARVLERHAQALREGLARFRV